MVKEIINFIKEKKQEKKDKKEREKQEEMRLNKHYPTKFVFLGKCEKEVQEDDLQYTYEHFEYFLANAKSYETTGFKRLTGEGVEDSNVFVLSQVLVLFGECKYGELFRVDDNGVEYEISTNDRNSAYSYWDNKYYRPLKDYISNINFLNDRSKVMARQQAINQKISESEMGEN